MSDRMKDAGISSGWYLLGGLAVGTAAGLLFAPKKGSESREEIAEWGRRNREKTWSMISRVDDALPARVKAAAAFGAVKGGASEVFNESRDKAKRLLGA